MKKKGLTLLEIIIATTLFFVIMVSILNAYTGVLKFKYIFQAKANMLETTYYMMEKVNVLIKDYTIDYDEYFNRSRVGCDSGYQTGFVWDVGANGYCDNFTFYGNGNSYSASSLTGYGLYFCSSSTGYFVNNEKVIDTLGTFSTGCLSPGYQSFGQYAYQFYDMKKDADEDGSVYKDSDDTDLGKGPDAILNTTGVQELYLISPDHKNRVFLRRALMGSGDWDKNGSITGSTERWYTLQILKLKGFDAGNLHTFDANTSSGVYDGKTDTWACDYSQGFICNGSGIGDLYSGYRLPSDANDGWVNLFDKNLTVADWNLTLYPAKSPDFARGEEAVQINPYFTIFLKTKLYGEIWQTRLGAALAGFEFSLQTTFNTRDSYSK
ncbi:MAG: hypothetical protein WCO66_03330 [Candidatus Absconditabacteria bacterium]